MKILVLGSRIPWPLHDGGAIATYQVLKGLSNQGAEVVYFSFNTRKHFVSKELIEKHFPFCRVIDFPLDANPNAFGAFKALLQGENYNISRFHNDAAKVSLKELLLREKFDVVHLEGLYVSPFIDVVKIAGLPVSLRQHNAEFQIWERLSKNSRNPLKKIYFRLLASQLKRHETEVLNRVDAIVPITHADLQLFSLMAPGKSMYLLPVGQDEKTVSRTEFSEKAFFHLGSMEWIPNVEAVKWLVDEVWPLVRAKMPDAALHLAGKGLHKNDTRFTASGITVHGEIDDAADYMQNHGVMLVPVFAAGGIRVKILEAFNAGVPVISTGVGIQGIPAKHQSELLVADSSQDFAAAMLELQSNNELRERCISNAHELVKKHFQTHTLISGLVTFYEDTVIKK